MQYEQIITLKFGNSKFESLIKKIAIGCHIQMEFKTCLRTAKRGWFGSISPVKNEYVIKGEEKDLDQFIDILDYLTYLSKISFNN